MDKLMNVDTPKGHRAKTEHNHAAAAETFRRAFDLCVAKTRSNIKQLADQPKAGPWAADGNYFTHTEGFNDIGNWTSSFFTGMALIAWRETEDEYFLNQVLRLADAYRAKATNPAFHSHHDMGFLYSLYSIALYKLTGDRCHRDTGIAAAEALYQRFNPKGGFIRAWGRLGTNEYENMAIIDCMMNLPLFYWAANETGDAKFRIAASAQADSTLKYFLRPDDSVCHAFRFDLQTGAPLGQDNYCGLAKNSFWARGAAWAIYGLAISYRYARDAKYLAASVRLAKKFIAQLDGEIVPMWDFKLTPQATRVRDASAAAIAICGFQELARFGAADEETLRAKDAMLWRICRDGYLEIDEGCPGILRNAQINPKGPGTAANVFASWGDYFLMEALAVELFKTETFW